MTSSHTSSGATSLRLPLPERSKRTLLSPDPEIAGAVRLSPCVGRESCCGARGCQLRRFLVSKCPIRLHEQGQFVIMPVSSIENGKA
jgi:hypothetical protein